MEKHQKILIITYYWPPAGGIAVKRWLSLSNEFAQLNAEVHVLTLDRDSAEYHTIDDHLLHSVDSRIHVHRISAWNPFHMTKRLFKKHIPPQGFASKKKAESGVNLLTKLRSNLFIPDPRKTWNSRSVRKALKIIDAHGIDALITTSPPHSVQLIGRQVARKRNINWIADFRDPWTDIFYYDQLGHSFFSRKVDAKFERQVLSEATAISTVSWGLKSLLEDKVPSRNPADFHVIPNGIDGEIVSSKLPDSSKIFRMVYTGMLTNLYEIEPFLCAIQQYNSAEDDRLIVFDFYGSIPPFYQEVLQNDYSFMHFHGNRSMDEIPRIQESADGLFLVGPKDYTSGHIPGKLFEYLRASRPIFYLGDEGSDVVRILEETHSGELFDRNESKKFPALLAETMKGQVVVGEVQQRKAVLSAYLRTNQAKKFLALADTLGVK
tara:strand:+ start:2987 stop:4291 length:1305 start_codon:yes stop_codon:yes gene_type:complete